MVCMCMLPGARGAQRRRSQPAFIIVMVMKLVSVIIKVVSALNLFSGGHNLQCLYISFTIRTTRKAVVSLDRIWAEFGGSPAS